MDATLEKLIDDLTVKAEKSRVLIRDWWLRISKKYGFDLHDGSDTQDNQIEHTTGVITSIKKIGHGKSQKQVAIVTKEEVDELLTIPNPDRIMQLIDSSINETCKRARLDIVNQLDDNTSVEQV